MCLIENKYTLYEIWNTSRQIKLSKHRNTQHKHEVTDVKIECAERHVNTCVCSRVSARARTHARTHTHTHTQKLQTHAASANISESRLVLTTAPVVIRRTADCTPYLFGTGHFSIVCHQPLLADVFPKPRSADCGRVANSRR